MKKIKMLIDKLTNSCEDEVVWHTPADEEQIVILERLINAKLPDDFKYFLKETGGGGVVAQEISGIENNDASIDFGGTVYGDTIRCREDFKLPKYLIVIYFIDNELYWCIDVSINNFGKVVNYDPYLKKIDGVISKDFTTFFEEYVTLRI